MSWIDKIKTDLIITTGDGKQYVPNWINASKKVAYNVAEFEFPKVEGTLVKRSLRKGTRYGIELYFQGEDHLDTSLAFERSAADSRAWTVTHPYYGLLLVQPIDLEFDNTAHNVTKISGVVVETIKDEYPKGTTNAADRIAAGAENTNTQLALAYSINTIPTAGEITKLQAQATKLYADGSKFTDAISADTYINTFKDATTAMAKAGNGVSKALQSARATIALIMAPAKFALSAYQRVNMLRDQALTLSTGITDVIPYGLKRNFETNAGANLSAMCLAAGTPLTTDYVNRNQVLAVIDLITDQYNQYLFNLDLLQSTNGGAPDSFIPDASALQLLDQLVKYTVSNLFNIASNARQQRSIILEYDSNWTVLAHRFYGLQADDSTITQLMEQNGAGLNEMLQVLKNRKIIYYV